MYDPSITVITKKNVLDAKEPGILDIFSAKSWVIKLAIDATVSILSVDQIIASRPTGDPNPNRDED